MLSKGNKKCISNELSHYNQAGLIIRHFTATSASEEEEEVKKNQPFCPVPVK